MEAAVEDAPIVKLVQAHPSGGDRSGLGRAHRADERDIRVRYRVDGVLHEVMRSPKRIQAGLITRLKVMADLNIAEKRIPQDGRSRCGSQRSLDLRVATLPTVYGEKIVIRILDKTNVLLQLSSSGSSRRRSRVRAFVPQAVRGDPGDGPTGSGKSTTLYATLNIVNSVDRHIITVEDPVEYRLPGINQIQVNPKAGLTFASALRSILRADPDIVLIGEIRDRETAMIAVESALTGHLVLSTLHTNDAPGDHATDRDGGRAVPGGLGRRLRGRPAARAQALREMQAGVPPEESELIEAGFAESRIPDLGVFFRP